MPSRSHSLASSSALKAPAAITLTNEIRKAGFQVTKMISRPQLELLHRKTFPDRYQDDEGFYSKVRNDEEEDTSPALAAAASKKPATSPEGDTAPYLAEAGEPKPSRSSGKKAARSDPDEEHGDDPPPRSVTETRVTYAGDELNRTVTSRTRLQS